GAEGVGEEGGEQAADWIESPVDLAAQKAADPPIDMRGVASDAQQSLAVIIGLDPHRAAHVATMRDAVPHAAQRNSDPVSKPYRLRQASKPRCDPAAMLLGELARFPQRAARRNGQND